MTCALAARIAFQHSKPPSIIDILWGQVSDVPHVEWVWIELVGFICFLGHVWWTLDDYWLSGDGLNQNLALKSQYERALQDLADLLETGQERADRRPENYRVFQKRKSNNYLINIRLYNKKKKKQKMSLNMCSSGCRRALMRFPPAHNKCFYYITRNLVDPRLFHQYVR